MSETQFVSTTKSESAGNGNLLVVAGGMLKNISAGTESALGQGEDNAIIGRFEGTMPNKYKPTKSDYKLRQDDGTLVILRETANIKRGFAAVNAGELVRVVYNGKRIMTKGKNAGKSVQDFDIQRAVLSAE